MTSGRSGGDSARVGQWVMLQYRLPREPSTPRIAVWRKLRRLGVAQLADGLVALPADPRTREQLEWIADEVLGAGGASGIWIAQPATAHQERELATTMAAARAAEYQAITAEATTGAGLDEAGRASLARRLRAELRRIVRRDYFPPPERDTARAAVDALIVPATAVTAQPAAEEVDR
ncbi:Chromate resistance protein ChrB [Pseudonocardia sp. ICBG1034]|uniref:Chromate resistance protein ChrB n=1 Tax=Pseudonocardia sp. ICBG1034 TaxID=2844381 RepID=UPI001CCA8910|nr:Chromate resistance protein ChrB [Pseudonocardia sp. ICBG1034]